MPRVASSTLRFVPLLASILFSSAMFSSPAWASCAPDRGQEQPQDAGPAVQAQEAQPPTAPVAAPDSDADASNEARAALAAIGPFAIDTYLPSMPAIGREFGVGPVAVPDCSGPAHSDAATVPQAVQKSITQKMDSTR